MPKPKRIRHPYADSNSFSKDSNPVPTDIQNTIITGDSLDVLGTFPDNCIDIVLTSPPYNFGKLYESYNDRETYDDYFNFLFDRFDECIRVLKYGGRLIFNVQPLLSNYIPTHHIISSHLMDRDMIWKTEIIWEKNNFNCSRTTWGSWMSPSSPYFRQTWEYIEVFCKGDLKKEGTVEEREFTIDEFKKWTIGKWSITAETKMKEKYGHPAMFPEQLVDRIVKLFSYKGDTVLDPFNGAGTTTAVAYRLDRKYIGIDISEQYNETARKRIRDNTNLFHLLTN